MAKKKMVFDPEIKEVVLNPEQAVLACNCFTDARWLGGAADRTGKFNGFGWGYFHYCSGKDRYIEPNCNYSYGWFSHHPASDIGSS